MEVRQGRLHWIWGHGVPSIQLVGKKWEGSFQIHRCRPLSYTEGERLLHSMGRMCALGKRGRPETGESWKTGIDPAFQNRATFYHQEPTSLQTRVSSISQHIRQWWEEHRSQNPRRYQGPSPASKGPTRGSGCSCCCRCCEHRLRSHGEPSRGWKGENLGTYQRTDKGEALRKASSPRPPLPEH